MVVAEKVKELIFGTGDATNKKNSYVLYDPDYKFDSEENKKRLKEFEKELEIERKHNKLPFA